MWEEELLISLKEDLDGMVWSEEEDGWRWSLEDTSVFTAKSAYGRLEGLVLREDRWREDDKWNFKQLWKIPAPSKVVAFAWKVLLDRIRSKVNLALQNVVPMEGSILCDLCTSRAGPRIFGALGETINCTLLIISIFFFLHFLLKNIYL